MFTKLKSVFATGSILHCCRFGLQRYSGADVGRHTTVRIHRLPNPLSGPVALLRL